MFKADPSFMTDLCNMRKKVIAAAVSILVLAMPATAMAARGGAGGARTGRSGGDDQGTTTHITADYLALGSGYDHSSGSALVRALQRRLAAAGFGPGPVDGLYGPHTEAATEAFQAATGLAVDGIAGPRTLAALSRPPPILYPGAGYGAEPSRRVGDLQRLLTRAGYEPGHADGLFGPRTEQAVRRFQGAHRLRVDGIAYPRILVALRDQLLAGHRTLLAARHRISPRIHPATVHPTSASPSPAHIPGPTIASPGPAQSPRPALTELTRQPPSGPSIPWVWLLAAAVAATLLVAAGMHARRRRPAAAIATANVPGSADGRLSETPSPASEDRAEPDKEFRLGVMFEKQNDPAAAEAAYCRADRQGHAAAASNLGVLLERRQELTGAAAAYRRAHERGDPGGAFNLALLLEEQGDLAGAEAAYRRGDLQGHAAAASNLGVLLEQRGDPAGAEAAYRRADRRGDPNGAYNLALLLQDKSDLAGAEAAYRRAHERGGAEVASAARGALASLRDSPWPEPTLLSRGARRIVRSG